MGDPEERRNRPAPRRTAATWSQFLRSQAEAILACDFFTADLLDGTQAYVLAVIEHATRRIRILGVTPHPTGAQAERLPAATSSSVRPAPGPALARPRLGCGQGWTGPLGPESRRRDCMMANVVVVVKISMSAAASTPVYLAMMGAAARSVTVSRWAFTPAQAFCP
jgi:hypothetical protein